MKIFNTENYNGIYISFHETVGMSFEDFEYKINLSCYNKKYELNIHPKNDLFHKDIEDISSYHKCIDVDYSYFDYIFKKLKEINYDVFLYDNMIVEDSGCIIFELSKNKYSLEVFYYPDILFDSKCSNHVFELNNIFENLKNKINYNEWYLNIQKKINM
jgi:hypothetical protein